VALVVWLARMNGKVKLFEELGRKWGQFENLKMG
jgi:hypothetical protein